MTDSSQGPQPAPIIGTGSKHADLDTLREISRRVLWLSTAIVDAPTGKGVEAQLIDIMGMGADGLVHAPWGVMDQMTLMQQLGAIPAGPPA